MDLVDKIIVVFFTLAVSAVAYSLAVSSTTQVTQYTTACNTAQGKQQCIPVDQLFDCSSRRTKESINNVIYANCVEHRD